MKIYKNRKIMCSSNSKPYITFDNIYADITDEINSIDVKWIGDSVLSFDFHFLDCTIDIGYVVSMKHTYRLCENDVPCKLIGIELDIDKFTDYIELDENDQLTENSKSQILELLQIYLESRNGFISHTDSLDDGKIWDAEEMLNHYNMKLDIKIDSQSYANFIDSALNDENKMYLIYVYQTEDDYNSPNLPLEQYDCSYNEYDYDSACAAAEYAVETGEVYYAAVREYLYIERWNGDDGESGFFGDIVYDCKQDNYNDDYGI